MDQWLLSVQLSGGSLPAVGGGFWKEDVSETLFVDPFPRNRLTCLGFINVAAQARARNRRDDARPYVRQIAHPPDGGALECTCGEIAHGAAARSGIARNCYDSAMSEKIVGILGGIIFLSIGFALSGISKSEDQVAPLANLISLPMMLLSGVFFSRSSLPGFAHVITDFFPLTYLADGLRAIAIEGAGLGDLLPQLTGLAVWCIITVFIAIRAFRWE